MKTVPIDSAAKLESEKAIRKCLSKAFADSDSHDSIASLRYVVAVRGMRQLARDSGLGCDSSYNTLKPSLGLTWFCLCVAPRDSTLSCTGFDRRRGPSNH